MNFIGRKWMMFFSKLILKRLRTRLSALYFNKLLELKGFH
jgi:hypothetical protein